ncbi:MAG: ABC transporter ATP-binding protein, partial [Pedobacter sp.]
MKILIPYLKNYKSLIGLALLLAAINQVFSLLDPYVFRLIIDRYITNIGEKHITTSEFIRGGGFLILCAMGAAMVSRIAKNFQDYYVNVITQRLGAKMYSDGLAHSLELPYQVFEDQRSGETLGILQKVRTDVEKLVQAMVNVLFTSLVGVVFVMVYAISVYWVIAVVYFSAVPLLGVLSSVLS